VSLSQQDFDEARGPRRKLRVLFVCIGNSCRSPMAEAIALRDASHLFDVSSAGLRPLGVVQQETLHTIERNGYPVDGLSSKGISDEVWHSADLVVNMSGLSRERNFPRADWHKVEDWDVYDPYGCEPDVYQSTLEDVRSRIELLIARYSSIE